MDYIDLEKPVLKDGEVLCDGCWKVTTTGQAVDKWKIYFFKHLNPLMLCQECQLKEGKDIELKQKMGL